MATGALAAPPLESACSLTFEATEKLLRTPHRSTASVTLAGRAVITEEMVFLHGRTYVRHPGGIWSPGASVEELSSAFLKRVQGADQLTCSYIHDELLDGQLTSLYKTHEESHQKANDTYLWILKNEGLIVKSNTEISGDSAGALKFSITNEFDNVRAPKL